MGMGGMVSKTPQIEHIPIPLAIMQEGQGVSKIWDFQSQGMHILYTCLFCHWSDICIYFFKNIT